MKKQIIATDKAPPASGPYSQAVRVGDLVYTAGTLGVMPADRSLAGPDVESQARQALTNLKHVLEAAGSCLDCVVKATVYLADIKDWPALNEIYKEYFTKDFPARAAFQVGALPMNPRVEIELVAVACDHCH